MLIRTIRTAIIIDTTVIHTPIIPTATMGIITSPMAITVTTAIHMAIPTVTVTGATMGDMGMEDTVLEDAATAKRGEENRPMAKPPIKKNDIVKRYEDLLEIARLVSWCMNHDYLIKTCLDHVSKRFGKRACCILLDAGEMKPYCRIDQHDSQTEHLRRCKEGVVWEVLEKGVAVNLIENHEAERDQQGPPQETRIEAIIPLWYVDQMTQEEKIVGALIIDSNGKGGPISPEDFDYLKLVGELIGGAMGKAELAEQLIEFYRKKEAIVKETAHAFRNRIEAIGGFSQRIARLAKDSGLATEARILHREIQCLEEHLERFEKYIDI